MSAPSTTSGAERAQNVPLGIAYMLLGMFVFSLNDTMAKWLAAAYPGPQMLMMRSIAGLIILSPVIARVGWRTFLAVDRPRLHVVRALIAGVETMLVYWAVRYLPLADVMTYYLAGPIYVTVMAALFLGEPVGWRRWLAVMVGFGGVLIALGPSLGTFGWPVLISIVGSVMYASFLVFTRTLRGTSDLVMAAWQVVFSLLVGAVVSPFVWQPFGGWRDALLTASLGVGALVGMVLVNRALSVAPASAVAPYQYTLIVWAALFGFLAFGDVPGWSMIAGAVIIVAAGLFIYFREARLGVAVIPEAPPEL